ncbi:hypothetical protein [Paenibacillus sp. IITD108]
MSDYRCQLCGDPMKHWNQGIYECEDCNQMIDGAILEEMEDDYE